MRLTIQLYLNGFQCEVMENNAKAGLDLKMLAVFVATLDARHALNEGFWFYSFTSFCWQRSALHFRQIWLRNTSSMEIKENA